MKKVTQSLLALLFAALPVTGFAAAADVLFSQKNSSNTAWANVIVAPTPSSALAFNSSKVPISTQALTLLSVTSPAGNDLTLAAGGTNQSVVLTPSGTGGVGIGTVTPAAKLEIAGTYADESSERTPATVEKLSVIVGGGGDGATYFKTGWSNSANSGIFTVGVGYFSSGSQVRDVITLRGSTGDVSISSSTAGSAGAGALVLQGGISAGNTGSAASYFGGAVSGNRAVSTGVANTNGDISLTINGNSSIGTAARWINQPSSAAYNWQLGTNLSGNWFSFMASTVVDGTTFSTDALKLTNTGAATFAGAVTMSAYGAGAATFDSSGNITSVSDARLKNITGTFTKGLAEIVKLTPKLYTWKPETGLVTDDINATLIAQDLIAAGLSEAVATYRTVPVMEDGVQSAEDIAAGKPVTQHAKLDANGKAVTKRVDANYSVSDRTVIAALVNAVKELKAEIDALKAAK